MTDDLTGLLIDLDFITEHWTDLAATRIPGTSRPWRQPLIDPDRRDAIAQRDADERATRDPDAPGFTSSAMHVDVLDVMVELWVTVHELATTTANTLLTLIPGKDRHPHAISQPALSLRRLDEMPTMLSWVTEWLPTAARLGDLERHTARAGRKLHRLTTEIQRLLSLLRGGQILAAAICPWCVGVTPKHPSGGATTLRVEEIERDKPANDHRPAMPALYAVVCWNPTCTPPEADCGTWWRGRPSWPAHEWDWLAKRLFTAEPAQTAAKPTVPRDYTIVPIQHSTRTGRAVEG